MTTSSRPRPPLTIYLKDYGCYAQADGQTWKLDLPKLPPLGLKRDWKSSGTLPSSYATPVDALPEGVVDHPVVLCVAKRVLPKGPIPDAAAHRLMDFVGWATILELDDCAIEERELGPDSLVTLADVSKVIDVGQSTLYRWLDSSPCAPLPASPPRSRPILYRWNDWRVWLLSPNNGVSSPILEKVRKGIPQ